MSYQNFMKPQLPFHAFNWDLIMNVKERENCTKKLESIIDMLHNRERESETKSSKFCSNRSPIHSPFTREYIKTVASLSEIKYLRNFSLSYNKLYASS